MCIQNEFTCCWVHIDIRRMDAWMNEWMKQLKSILVWLPLQQQNSNYIKWYILAGGSLLVLIHFKVFFQLSEIIILPTRNKPVIIQYTKKVTATSDLMTYTLYLT